MVLETGKRIDIVDINSRIGVQYKHAKKIIKIDWQSY